MSTPKVKQIKVEPLQQGPTRSRQANGINNGLNDNNNVNNSNCNGSKSYGAREKGVIEKMLASYGFVQCTERRGRFFFHYSEYKGNLNSLKVGDAVEFQESTDKRTHKPVAILIVKLNDFSSDVVGGKQFEGVVLTDAKTRGSSSGDYSSPEMGRVTYEQGGETFFLPFAGEDVENGQRVAVGDKVMFVVANDLGTGSMRARRLRKKSCDLHQGVVCSMKDNFGFIERADVVKEIFFHFSEFEGDIEDLALGDDVEYGIQVRNNKDVAVNIHKIAPGSVVFEDVARDVMRGRIKKTLKMTSNKKVNDALIGRIVSETVTGPIEIVFGEKDPVGDFTMFVGDIVEFSIATDRRDKVQHATNIRLVDDTFSISKEKREKGFITTLKEGFGFIRCTDREARMFFHFSELLNADHKLTLQDEIDFTVIQDPTNATRQVAVRIKVLPRGTIVVQSSSSSLDKFVGTIQKEAGNLRSIQGSKDPDPGILMYEVEGTKQMIPYSSSVVDGNLPKLDEKVEFQISECQKNKTKVAMNVRVIGRTTGREKERGFVVTIKEGFGFIETSDHEKEIYFHFSNFEGDVDSLEVGYEVEFQICNKAGRVSAECIRRIPNKSIQIGEVHATMLEGRIARGLHSQDSSEYFGLIQLTSSDAEAEVPPTPTSAPPTNPIGTTGGFPFPSESGTLFPFSIMSLVDKRETLLARGDLVRFQLVEVQGGVVSNGSINGKEFNRSDSTSGGVTKKKWAYRVAPFRKFIHAKIETLNETGGALSYETDLGARLTFNLKDVQDPSELCVGDEVEFVVLQMNGGGKMAVNIQKATDRPRPERLLSRIKSVTDEQYPRAMATRQPKGPDGTKGFRCLRKEVDRNQPDKNSKIVVESLKEMVMAGGDAVVCGDAGVAKFEEGEVFEGIHGGHADGSQA